MLIPYRADVPVSRWPVANWLLIAVTIIIFFLYVFDGISEETVNSMVLGQSAWGWPGHLLLHGGIFHLFGNMIFLWVFGNAICAKVGNVYYLPLYLALGLVAAATHMAFDGGLAVGASGAINGIVGMFLVWYPLNAVSCVYLFFFFVFVRGGAFALSSFWIILMWLAFDILGALMRTGGTAYYAHLGGFFAGAGVGLAFLLLGWVKMDQGERSILMALGLVPDPDRGPPRFGRKSPPAERAPAEAGLARPADRPSAADRAAPDIRFQCLCGRHLKAARAHAGRHTRCPYCNAPIRIPGGGGQSTGPQQIEEH